MEGEATCEICGFPDVVHMGPGGHSPMCESAGQLLDRLRAHEAAKLAAAHARGRSEAISDCIVALTDRGYWTADECAERLAALLTRAAEGAR